jgi:formylglycine-generating enzyme required for sulfatase activity
MRARLSLLFGLSGLGKTSLLRAGLFPLLRHTENILPVYIRLDFKAEKLDLRAQVLQELFNEAMASDIEMPSATGFGEASSSSPPNGITLWEYFHHTGADFWDKKNRPVTPLLVFDQFEEVFTIGRTNPSAAKEVESFLDELSDLAAGRAPQSVKERLEAKPQEAAQYSFSRHNYKLLLSMREDFLPEIEGLRDRFADVALNRMRLMPMNGEAALTVVEQAPDLVDADVAEQIVRFVATARPDQKLGDVEADPAILSVICYELNHQRRERKESKITLELLEGSKEEVLGKFCEGAFDGLTPEVRHFVEDKLLTASGHRDSCAQENALSLPGVTQSAIDTLVERRLIRREEHRGVARLELTHDRLAAPIRLNREQRRKAQQLEHEQAIARAAQERELASLRATRRVWIIASISVTAFALAVAVACAVYTVVQQRQNIHDASVWTDARTGLTWTKTAGSPKGHDLETQAAAVQYCKDLPLDGQSDWRLPSVSELLSAARSETDTGNHDIYRAAEVWSDSAGGWLQSPNLHWTVKTDYSAGLQALCVRGKMRSELPSVILPASFAFASIPAGNFYMGCSPGDSDCNASEKPRHRVVISKAFEMSKYLVTQSIWHSVMGTNPSRFKKDGENRPIDAANWYDTQVFVSVLNDARDGFIYGLPSEAEWEYAARAGTTGARYDELDKVAWYGKNSDNETHPVGLKEPNAWGLYDTLGSAWKWVQDPYRPDGYNTAAPKDEPKGAQSEPWRIRRGGSWVDLPISIRFSRRVMDDPDNPGTGFFIVREREALP